MKGNVLVKVLLNSLLGLVLVFIWSRFVNIAQIGQILQTADLKVVVIFILLFVFSGVLRSLRLKLMLKNNHLPLKDVLMLNFLSQFLSFLIPVRAGEITKSAYLTSQFGLPLGKSLVWVFVDRFLDFWAVLLVISIALLSVSTNLPAKSVFLAVALFLFFNVILFASLFDEQRFKAAVKVLSRLLVAGKVQGWFVRFTHTIIEGFGVLRRDPPGFALLLGLSVLAMVSDGMIWFFVLSSLGVSFGLGKSIFGNALTALTFLVPAAPGYVGSAEAAGLGVFGGILGLDSNLASAAAVLFHVLTIVTVLVLGITSLYFLKFDLGVVWKKLKKEE